MNEHDINTAKHMVDAISVLTVVGTLMNILPAVAALFTIIWTGIRIWETDTVRELTGRVKSKGAKDGDEE